MIQCLYFSLCTVYPVASYLFEKKHTDSDLSCKYHLNDKVYNTTMMIAGLFSQPMYNNPIVVLLYTVYSNFCA
jgi:hypothetical protein